ncbi:MAG: efflux RND transporter periplasmic adaptor subunit [Deltaproteobacteria bacterium]|nr:efflux RND transporter periplasmic adaptor subunit [Deltaproteobacteria bacterium]
MKRHAYPFVLLTIGLLIGAGIVIFFSGTGTNILITDKDRDTGVKAAKKILYYRNSMDGSITSPVPMKDPMGMDYIPVYAEAANAPDAPGIIRMSAMKIQKAGVKSEQAARMPLKRLIRTVGRVEPVEGRVFIINAKVSGWVEKLHVNKTDSMVSQGEPLLELYSPELVSAQEEYLLAHRGAQRVKDSPYEDARQGAGRLLEAARKRLGYWDISEDQIKGLVESNQVKRTMTIRAPSAGSVTDKMVIEGKRIEAGEPLFKIIDHSVVWVYGEVYEYELPHIKTGQNARLTPSYSLTDVYTGRIEHIYSHLGGIRYAPEEGTEARTAKVRFELPNPAHRLKLGMYLNVEINVDIAQNAIVVPDAAVIDTGIRQVVIIDRRDGTFEPRVVKIGAKADEYREILSGIKPGEWVVSAAAFLIDSESNLNAALGALTASGQAGEKPPETAAKPASSHAGH